MFHYSFICILLPCVVTCNRSFVHWPMGARSLKSSKLTEDIVMTLLTEVPTPYLLSSVHRTGICTLGVVGVVRVFVADAHNTSRGPKCQILTKKPVFFLSEQNRMSTPSVQKIWAKKLLIISRNSAKHIWPHWPNIEVPEKAEPGKRSSVIMLDTSSQVAFRYSTEFKYFEKSIMEFIGILCC